MRVFWDWFIKNLSNIFSFIGILLTLYFGIYYVPNWLRETQNVKIENAKINLEQSIKELVYSDIPCLYLEIETLIKAKEIELNEVFPLSREQVLTITQESFMQDKFLPLEIRKSLMAEIENIKSELPKEKLIVPEKKALSSTVFYEWLSIVASIITVFLGIISFFVRFRTEKNKQEEIDNQLNKNDEVNTHIENYQDFEKSICNEIKNIKGVEVLKTSSDRDFDFDLCFSYNGKPYFVEVKYLTKSKIGLSSFQKFLSNLRGMEGEFWFIYNTDLTEMVKREAFKSQLLETENRKINLIHAIDSEMFRSQLSSLLNGKNITT